MSNFFHVLFWPCVQAADGTKWSCGDNSVCIANILLAHKLASCTGNVNQMSKVMLQARVIAVEGVNPSNIGSFCAHSQKRASR